MGKRINTMEEQKFVIQFGKNVKKLREEHHITQAELAKKMHMTIQTLSDIENGRTNCKQSTGYLIAKALGIELYRLYELDMEV